MVSVTPELTVQISPNAMVWSVDIVVSTANVIEAACASWIVNVDNVKIKTAKRERYTKLFKSLSPRMSRYHPCKCN